MSGIIAVYGLVIAVLIAGDMAPPPTQHMSLYTYVRLDDCLGCCVILMCCDSGFMHLASGLSVGLAGVAAGYAIGIVGDAVSVPVGLLLLVLLLIVAGGRTSVHATIPGLRWNDPDIDFWRGSWSLWV